MVRAAITLPTTELFPPPVRPPITTRQPALPRVEVIARSGPVLLPSPWNDRPDVLGVNLNLGCAHRCTFCSVRGTQSYPGDDLLRLFPDTPERLDAELQSRSTLPRAIFVSPNTDPFPPLAEVQAETARVIDVVARHGVDVWLMTRGAIRPSVMHVIAKNADRVKVTIGLTTLDRPLRRALEPLAAPIRTRLRQIRDLKQMGIGVQLALEPLLPGVTDTRENLVPLLEAVAAAGIRHVTAGYLFLRSGLEDSLFRSLEPLGYADLIRAEYQGGPTLGTGGAAARYLPKPRRQRGYAALMSLASRYDVTVRLCSLTNPDFRAPTTATEAPVVPVNRLRQRVLPLVG